MLALADKRATVVRAYLESIGATAAQLKNVSYVREQPLCTALDDECVKNRRGELRLQTAARTKKPKR
jgi:outer membrane protein OmpA-like peptidoglycan-associated protein